MRQAGAGAVVVLFFFFLGVRPSASGGWEREFKYSFSHQANIVGEPSSTTLHNISQPSAHMPKHTQAHVSDHAKRPANSPTHIRSKPRLITRVSTHHIRHAEEEQHIQQTPRPAGTHLSTRERERERERFRVPHSHLIDDTTRPHPRPRLTRCYHPSSTLQSKK